MTSADFTFIQTYFLFTDDAECCGVFTGGGPRTEVSLAELDEIGAGDLGVADLNRDGWIDQTDVIAFINGARPDQPAPFELTPVAPEHQAKRSVEDAPPAQERLRP